MRRNKGRPLTKKHRAALALGQRKRQERVRLATLVLERLEQEKVLVIKDEASEVETCVR